MSKIKDVCSCRVQNIEEPLLQQIRYLDKLVEGLVKSTPMGKNTSKITAVSFYNNKASVMEALLLIDAYEKN